MPNSERYTEAQKNLLKIDMKDLTEAEKKVLRRALLPRKRYVPQTEEEGFSLARDMLGDEMYASFFAGVNARPFVKRNTPFFFLNIRDSAPMMASSPIHPAE